MCSKISWCFGHSYFLDHLSEYVDALGDDKIEERRYFLYRFNRLIKRLEENTKRSSFWYYSLSGIVTIGSILVPPLLSIQKRDVDNKELYEENVYWAVWSISLIVTLSNAFIKLLSLDKSYITRNLRVNQFRSEAMKYITRTEEYAGKTDKKMFSIFVKNIENMRRIQINEEYNSSEGDVNINSGADNDSMSTFV